MEEYFSFNSISTNCFSGALHVIKILNGVLNKYEFLISIRHFGGTSSFKNFNRSISVISLYLKENSS